MANWTLISLLRGIRTTRWPRGDDLPPGAMPLRLDGLPDRAGAKAPTDQSTWTWRTPNSQGPLPVRFRHSVHVRFVDAGANGALLGEVRLIDAPPYNLHRFGIFNTASPREADVLLVGGPVTEAMREPLRKAYEAMPTPKRVVAIGDDAIDGGVFGQTFASAGGVARVIPVDFIVPGCPPPPLAIIHGLLAAAGQVTVPVQEVQP
jgi:Ni,Fe-hydrogenase III small subunit